MRTVVLGFVATIMAVLPAWGQELTPIKLAEGVYAITGPRGAINTGFVVGDRGVFVYSCQLAEYDQRLAAIRSVAGGKPIRFVANGHYAWDDVGCNHMLAEQGAVILGNPEFARLLRPYWAGRVAGDLKGGRVKKEYLEGKRVEMALPSVLFDQKLTLDLGTHVVELIFMGKAHTPDNTVAWLPREKVLFTNDLLFAELHPVADERSDIANWQRILKTLAGWDPASVVPGHGRFTAGNGPKSLLELDRYWETLRGKVRTMKESGKSLEDVKKGIGAEFTEFSSWGKGGRLEPAEAVRSAAELIYGELSK
ncbi:MAG TPA: MBL fold metallo-hydrolase [Methylomirabilota bacterium]|jgi:cyclase|nr:MBL fold metallo-hydrolase [Methylomirabilota bacterium]